MLKTCVALVTYNTYGNYEWTDICVRSFRHTFNNTVPLIVVDHNRNEAERKFLNEHEAIILEQSSEYDRSHGAGLDTAVRWAKEHNYEAIVLVEPDCIFESQKWYHEMQRQMMDGAAMVATFRHQYGPLHPAGSAWRISDIPGSFRSVPKDDHVYHPDYSALVKLDTLAKSVIDAEYNSHLCGFFMYHWDVGIRNWFLLEILKKKTVLINHDGFWHFWRSHARTPRQLVASNDWPKSIIAPWLDNRPKTNKKTFI